MASNTIQPISSNTYTAMRTTPWGPAQHVTTVLPGVLYRVETAGHGGYFVPSAYVEGLSPTSSPVVTSYGQFYEEDCEWALAWLGLLPLIVTHFDDLDLWHQQQFSDLSASALRMVATYYPQYEILPTM